VTKVFAKLDSLLTPTTIAGVKRLATSVCLCVSVCLHNKTKMAETTITKFATRIVLAHQLVGPIRSNDSRSRSHGHWVQKAIKCPSTGGSRTFIREGGWQDCPPPWIRRCAHPLVQVFCSTRLRASSFVACFLRRIYIDLHFKGSMLPRNCLFKAKASALYVKIGHTKACISRDFSVLLIVRLLHSVLGWPCDG